MSTSCVALQDYWRIYFQQIVERLAHGIDQTHAIAALADIRFQNEWQRDVAFTTETMQRKQAISCCPAVEQVGICDKIDIYVLKLP